MDFLKLVTEARTCRRYIGSRELEPGFLAWLVDCARLCPSGGNAQSLRYITVQSPEKRPLVCEALIWAGALPEWPGPIGGERPAGYIVLLAPAGEDGKISPMVRTDLGIAAQTMQLAAWSRGVAACMFSNIKPKELAKAVPAPEGYTPLLVMAFGYPVEQREIVSVPADGSTKYYRDEQGVHYVPKRDLKTVLLQEL